MPDPASLRNLRPWGPGQSATRRGARGIPLRQIVGHRIISDRRCRVLTRPPASGYRSKRMTTRLGCWGTAPAVRSLGLGAKEMSRVVLVSGSKPTEVSTAKRIVWTVDFDLDRALSPQWRLLPPTRPNTTPRVEPPTPGFSVRDSARGSSPRRRRRLRQDPREVFLVLRTAKADFSGGGALNRARVALGT